MGQTKNQKLSWTCFIYTKDAIRIQYFLKGRFVYYPGSALKRHIPRPHSETRRQKLWWCSWEIWFSSQVSMVLGLVKVWEPQSFGWFEVNQIWQQRFLQKCIYCITYHPVTHIGGLPTHSDRSIHTYALWSPRTQINIPVERRNNSCKTIRNQALDFTAKKDACTQIHHSTNQMKVNLLWPRGRNTEATAMPFSPLWAQNPSFRLGSPNSVASRVITDSQGERL